MAWEEGRRSQHPPEPRPRESPRKSPRCPGAEGGAGKGRALQKHRSRARAIMRGNAALTRGDVRREDPGWRQGPVPRTWDGRPENGAERRRRDVGSVQACGGTRRGPRSPRLFRANQTSAPSSSQQPRALLGGGRRPVLVPGRRPSVHLGQRLRVMPGRHPPSARRRRRGGREPGPQRHVAASAKPGAMRFSPPCSERQHTLRSSHLSETFLLHATKHGRLR